jgi:hypothetical protein
MFGGIDIQIRKGKDSASTMILFYDITEGPGPASFEHRNTGMRIVLPLFTG